MSDDLEAIRKKKLKELKKKLELKSLPYKIDVDEKTFDKEVIERSKEVSVIVDFWAEWCKPCLLIAPILESLAKKYKGKVILAKVNVDENRNLAAKYGIMSIPTVKMFKNGKPVDEFIGVIPKEAIEKWIRRYIDAED